MSVCGPDQLQHPEHPEQPEHLASGKPAGAGDFILERRHRLVKQRAGLSGENLLDFGCGNGEQTLFFAADFPFVTGIDITRSSLEAFQQEIDRRGVAQRVSPLHYEGGKMPLADSSMDAVTSFEVLEHVPDELATLREIHRVLRPGGRFALTVPNRWWIFETHGTSLPLLPWNRVPFFSWLPRSLHDRWARARNYRRRQIISLIQDAGFQVQDSAYVMAPLDVLKWQALRNFLRGTFFRGDTTIFPWQATAILIVAEKPA